MVEFERFLDYLSRRVKKLVEDGYLSFDDSCAYLAKIESLKIDNQSQLIDKVELNLLADEIQVKVNTGYCKKR